MLTYQDCLDLAEITEDEVLAIADHEHIPRIVALELGNYLLHLPDGTIAIKKFILDDIAMAERSGDAERALHLKVTLKHFVDTHPENKNEPAPDQASDGKKRKAKGAM